MNEPAPLHPLYYRDNFEQLCETAWSQYEDLLTERDRAFRSAFQAAGEEGRCLYIRLVSRRGPLFRRETLAYPELGDLSAPIGELQELGLLVAVEQPEPVDLLNCLRKPEILAIYGGQLPGARSWTKGKLVDTLVADYTAADLVTAWQAAEEGPAQLLEVAYRDCVELLQLLFFGNRRQSLTDFVLSDLGMVRYADYRLDRAHRLFLDRAEIDDYLAVSDLRESFHAAREAADRDALLALAEPLLTPGPSALLEQRRDRLRNRVARQLEREVSLDTALRLYESSGTHPARERRVRILEKQQRFIDALALCREMARAPWCEEERDFLRRAPVRLERKLGQRPSPLPRDRFTERRLAIPRSDSVERAVAACLENEWPEVHYVENSLVCAVFGLAFWEQIFLALPGAFVNPFQSAPLDMDSPAFYQRRAHAVEARIDELLRGDLAAEICRVYDAKLGLSNRWVNWRWLDRDLLQAALQTVPPAHWLGTWRRLLFDPVSNRGGIPDLIALDPGVNYCLVEVKGPGDQLQLNQRRWLRYFDEAGIPAQVAWVTWSDG